MVRAERNTEKHSSAAETLVRKQSNRRTAIDAMYAGEGFTMAGFALVVIGAIADSLATIDVGLVGMAAGLAMRFGAQTERWQKAR